LGSILLPASVTSIEEEAFSDCLSLSEVHFGLPSNLVSIGVRAFAWCALLQTLHIPGSVSAIGGGFIENSLVSDLTVDDVNPHFHICHPFLISQDDPSVVFCMGGEAKIVISSYVVILKAESFSRLEGLEEVSFEGGSQLQTIEERAFRFAFSLRSILLPGSLEVIGVGAFYGCRSLAVVRFETPSKLRLIDESAFSGCGSLTSIALPSSVEVGGELSFGSCANLKAVTFEPGSLPRRIHRRAFDDCNCLDRRFLGEEEG
jgi:hypothetical protein